MADGNKILVVDDDPDICESLRMVLESSDFEVGIAASAQDAFKALETFHPDLILLDIMMPSGTEGFQFVWKLRNEYPEPLSQTPIVVLTAIHSTTRLRFYPEETDGTYAPGEYLPVQGFLDKPVEPSALLSTIREVLGS